MESAEGLGKQCVPINKLKKSSTKWVIKVLVIQRGLIKPYKNARGEGFLWRLTFIDEERTKIQATLFNKQIEDWKEYFEANNIYYIRNGQLNSVNTNFLSVHKEFSLVFNENTEVKTCNDGFNYLNFSNGFIALGEAENLNEGSLFDVVCIVIMVKPLVGEGRNKRREVIVMNERYERVSLTLWDEFAEIDGKVLDNLKNDKHVVAFCDVKPSPYKGSFGIATTPISSVLINPNFPKAEDLKKWNESMRAVNKDLTLMPSTLIRKAREVKISDLTDGLLHNVKGVYYKFNAMVTGIKYKNDPWYSSCNKCYKKVIILNNSATCDYCKRENVDYEYRYRLQIVASHEESEINVSAFDATRYLTGCDVKDYILSTSIKKEDSQYYRNLVLSKGKEFTFIVKNETKTVEDVTNQSFVAVELHEIEKLAALEIQAEDAGKTLKGKGIKEDDDTYEGQYQYKAKKIKVEKD